MNLQRLLTLILIGIVVTVGYLVGTDMYSQSSSRQEGESPVDSETTTEECVPTFADGGGPYYLPDAPFREKVVPEVNNGERLIVRGKILQNDCVTPVQNAILDIWQANESGDYQDEWYRGQVRAGEDGTYLFETVVPKGYGEGTGYRPPHIHFKVFIDDQEIITSQMFFPEVAGTPGFDDAYIMDVTTERTDDSVLHEGYHDIVLP